jgi:60 kDa SS-A/Ro ribonucleoprotein
MRTNTTSTAANARRERELPRSLGGGTGSIVHGEARLRRMVATCLLWEDLYYQEGQAQARELAQAVAEANPVEVASVAIDARTLYKLRHVPLYLVSLLEQNRAMARGLVARTLAQVIQRPDELAEFLAIHARLNGRKTSDLKRLLSAQVKKGLALAFAKFNPYQLAKWNRDSDVKLRDVLNLCHAKPKNAEQARTWKALLAGTLETADTWEAALSAGKDKKATWERLIRDEKLGDMALLMNLRNMVTAGVDEALVREALGRATFERILPFRFVAAAEAAPRFEPELDAGMIRAMAGYEKLPGSTGLLIDGSSSMDNQLSAKGTLNRLDAAAALAMLLREVCPDVRVAVYTASQYANDQTLKIAEVPARRGMALADVISKAIMPRGGTPTYAAGRWCRENWKVDRFILLTDGQATDHGVLYPVGRKTNYVVQIAPHKLGVAAKGGYVEVNGFSERVVDFIAAHEDLEQKGFTIS